MKEQMRYICLFVSQKKVRSFMMSATLRGGGGAAQKMIQKIISDGGTNEVNLSVCQSKEGPFIYDVSHFERRGGEGLPKR